MSNLFQTAATIAKKAPKKSEKEIVRIPELAGAIDTFNSTKEQIDFLTSQLETAQAEIHESGRKAFLTLYKTNHHNPDSFIIEADDERRVMYLPMDKYKTIDEERAAVLNKKYDHIAGSATEYSFDPLLLEKYGDILSALITESKEIADDDKGSLIVAKTKHSVVKGAIDRLLESLDPAEMLSDIAAIIALKRA